VNDIVAKLKRQDESGEGYRPYPDFVTPGDAAARIAELEAALRKINELIDSPARWNGDIQDVLDSVIDTSDPAIIG
jgi:hypothetical protein